MNYEYRLDQVVQVARIIFWTGTIELLANWMFTLLFAVRILSGGETVTLSGLFAFYDMIVRLPPLYASVPAVGGETVAAIVSSYVLAVLVVGVVVRKA